MMDEKELSLGLYIILNIDPEIKPIIQHLFEKHGNVTFEHVDITKTLSRIDDEKLIKVIKDWFKLRGMKL